MAKGEPGDRWAYETCDRCERRGPSFWVDDDAWLAVMQDEQYGDVSGVHSRVCSTCFDELADTKDVVYTFRAVHVLSWSQGFYGEWPHLDVPCAECVARDTRRSVWLKRVSA